MQHHHAEIGGSVISVEQLFGEILQIGASSLPADEDVLRVSTALIKLASIRGLHIH